MAASASANTDAQTDYRVSAQLETVYLALVIGGGQVLIPVLIVLSCMRGFGRHPTLLNYLATWLLYSLATCVLLYSGNGYEAHPSESVCTAQVSLQQTALLIIAASAVSLMLQLWFTLPTVSKMRAPSALRDGLLVTMPYIIGALYIAAFYVVHAYAPQYTPVERGRYTCRIASTSRSGFFSKFAPLITGLALIICLCMSIWMLKKTVKRVITVSWTLKDSLRTSSGRSWLPILARFSLFGAYAVLSIVATLVVVLTPQGPAHDVIDWYTVTLPMIAFFIFVPWPQCSRSKSKPATTSTTHHLPMQWQTTTLVNPGYVETKEDPFEHQYQHQYRQPEPQPQLHEQQYNRYEHQPSYQQYESYQHHPQYYS